MKELFTIFVVDDSIDENALEHYLVVQWSYENLDSPNVIALTEKDILDLTNQGVFEVISELNNSLIGYGEDDWILENKVKIEVLDRLNIMNIKGSIIDKLKNLLQYSIYKNRNLYFHFY